MAGDGQAGRLPAWMCVPSCALVSVCLSVRPSVFQDQKRNERQKSSPRRGGGCPPKQNVTPGTANVQSAIATAKRCRPVVDPIGTLPELLRKLEAAYKDEPPRNRFPEPHFR